MSAIVHPAVRVEALPAELALLTEIGMIDRFLEPSVDYLVRFWTTEQCLVAPRSLSRSSRFISACDELASIGWPVLIRHTGGDVTPQGHGILNVSIAFALDAEEHPSIDGTYETLSAPIISLVNSLGGDAFTGSVPGCFCDGRYNVVIDGCKMAGTAQRWRRSGGQYSRQVVFAHALLLIDADIHSGVAAINKLYDACGICSRVDPGTHANLSMFSTPELPVSCVSVARALDSGYHAALSELTR